MGDLDGGNELSNVVQLKPRNIYGLRTDVIGNIHFNLANEVIYPVEGVLAFHDYVLNCQRFMRLPEDVVPKIITLSPNRRLLAVLESTVKPNASATINVVIYEIATFKKRRTLVPPEDLKLATIVQMSFTHDSKAIVLLSAPPNEVLCMMIMDKTGTTLDYHPSNANARGAVEVFACHLQDANVMAVGGPSILTILMRSEKGIGVTNNVKVGFHCFSMAFITPDLLMCGTTENELVMVENNEIKMRQKASDAEAFDLAWDQDTLDRELMQRLPSEEKYYDNRVFCMTAFARGFAFAIFNKVFVFERITKFKFERKTILTIPLGNYPEPTYQIKYLALDAKQETIIVTTEHAQIYVGILIVPETLKARHLEFQPLGSLIHIGEIVDMSVCLWKPVIMTASKDQTVRIWNYETDKIELVRKFQVDIIIVELNATGLLAAVGFADQLRITQVFMDELNICKTYNLPRCKSVKYSNFGHLMAAAHDNMITITSTYNLDILLSLKGHNGTVLTIAWSSNDRYLFSGGAEGAIYQWDMETGARVQEIVQKGTEYRSLSISGGNPMSVYCGTNFGVLREFQDSELVRELTIPSKVKAPITNVCLSRSDQIMFVANEEGDLFHVQVPFLDANTSCRNFRFFVSAINKILFSADGTMLIVASKAGTLSIWNLENIDGKVKPIDPDLLKSQEIQVPRTILHEKNEQIASLEVRLKQQAEEFQYQLSQNEIFDGQQLAEVHRTYCQALEELKNKNNEIEQRHTEEMNQITFQINEIKNDHKKQMDSLSSQYSERMLIEYQKFTHLRESMLELRESYEEKLKMSAGTLQDTVEGLESNYKSELDERKELIRELMREMQDKKIEFVEYCRQVEIENDRNMVEVQIKYENKLTSERNETQVWRGKAGVLEKRYESLCKETETLMEEVETLKEEHLKLQRNIGTLMHNIEDLQKDISDREYAINAKEKRIQELLHKNQELDKYKQVLSHKIAELKAQIEPREFQINDKRKHIIEMEHELAGLNESNSQLELQLKELKDKYISNVAELNDEKHRARAARECIHNICSEIYFVAGKIDSPEELKGAVKALFQKHASDDELKRFISLDAKVRDEFQRQRAQIEKVLETYKNRSQDNTMKRKYAKLYRENCELLEEIENVRNENELLRTKIKKELENQTKIKPKTITK